MTFAEHVLKFNKNLKLNLPLPENVEVLNPYQNAIAFKLCSQFYNKYYNDSIERTLILGINPGRFGGGVTGIPFTDPLKLELHCNIPNSFLKRTELSADFIYKMIEGYGGVEKFYSKFYISAVCPLGFTRDGKNLNYYDITQLQKSLMSFIIESLEKQLTFGMSKEVCYCLGEGSNFKFLNKLNQQYLFFKKNSTTSPSKIYHAIPP